MRNSTKRLMSIIAAVTMAATPIAPAVMQSAPVLAAQRMGSGQIMMKRGTVLYQLRLNRKGNKVASARGIRAGRHFAHVRGGRARAFWTVRVKGHTYYYLGNQGRKMLAVRAGGVSRHGRVLTLGAFMKKNSKSNRKGIRIPVKRVNPLSLAVQAKTKQDTVYGFIGKDNKVTASSSNMPSGTSISILFKVAGVFTTQGGQKMDGYYAYYNGKAIIIPAEAVDVSESTVPDEKAFVKNLQAKDAAYVKKQVNAYKKAHHLR